ncbi:MAG TPA: Fur family transcriptional regulator [Armatimonadota bacterium]|nr:Fur family transcriptional regulator [Armatimonadota bacterium]
MTRIAPQPRLTALRLALLQILRGSRRHLTAAEIYELARADGVNSSFAGVYNGLHFLEEAGLISEIGQGSGVSQYHASVEQRDHLVCAVCGVTSHVRVPETGLIARSIGEDAGFRVLEYRVTITGVCPNCQENEERGAMGLQ